jgi:hypothetical protein
MPSPTFDADNNNNNNNNNIHRKNRPRHSSWMPSQAKDEDEAEF